MNSVVFGRITKLQFRNVGEQLTNAMLRVHFRTPMDTIEHQDFQNTMWNVNNPTLQFLALHGYKPSDFEGTTLDVEADQWLLPVVCDAEGEWSLAQRAIDGGEQALRRAEWFGGAWPEDDDEDSQDDTQSVDVDVQ